MSLWNFEERGRFDWIVHSVVVLFVFVLVFSLPLIARISVSPARAFSTPTLHETPFPSVLAAIKSQFWQCIPHSCSNILSSDGLHTSDFSSGCVDDCIIGCDSTETEEEEEDRSDDDDDDDVAVCVVCVFSVDCFCGMGIGCWLNSSASSSGVGYEASAGFSTRTGETVETMETVEPNREMGAGRHEESCAEAWREPREGETQSESAASIG